MYRDFFGINENPFSNSPDPKYIFMSQRHSEALAHLMWGVQGDNGFVMLTGEVGTGKTTLCRYLAEQLDDHVKLALCLNPKISDVDLLTTICEELGIDITDVVHTVKDLTSVLNTFLLDLYANGGRAVLMIDEAQNLSFELLEQVRLLTNLETTHNKLLQVILVGQTELKDHIDQFSLRQLSQRISARYHLDPLNATETDQYIAHRIAIAGLPQALFSASALNIIYKNSRGIPRLINSICDRCLLGAYVAGKKVVSKRLATNATDEVLGTKAPSLNKLTPITVMAATVLTIWIIAYGLFGLLNLPLPFGLNTTHNAGSPSEPGPAISGRIDEYTEQTTRLLAALEPADTVEAAFLRMIALWKTKKGFQGETVSCQDTANVGLACLNWEGSWDEVRQLNRPFIIELVTPQGDAHSVLVRTLQDGSATLELSARLVQIPEHMLRALRPGNFLLLWQPPPFYNRTLRPNMTGNDVAWVRKRLNKASLGLPVAVSNPEYYDDSLLKEVNSFNRRHNRPDDGLIDPATLILMDNTLGDVIVPVLYQNP